MLEIEPKIANSVAVDMLALAYAICDTHSAGSALLAVIIRMLSVNTGLHTCLRG